MRLSSRARFDYEGNVRVGGAFSLPGVLVELGADPASLLQECGVDPGLFSDPDNRISYRVRGRLLSFCAERTGCNHFGLLVGLRGGLQSLGLVGLLARHSGDVGTALNSIVRYLHLHVHGAVVSLREEGDHAIFSYAIHASDVDGADQIADGAVAMMLSVMRTLCTPTWVPCEVRISHARPDDVGPYRRLFRAPLQFDATENALVFERRWLAHRLPAADGELRRLVQRQLDAMDVHHADPFAEQVRSLLSAGLLTGHATEARVAALLQVHTRTLSRRLLAGGTSFREILDQCRNSVATQMLENTRLEVAEIAAAVGYSDPSAFTRAFRRWSATTPAAWRAARRHPPTPEYVRRDRSSVLR
jgi:AraC-like DNA-binding protein